MLIAKSVPEYSIIFSINLDSYKKVQEAKDKETKQKCFVFKKINTYLFLF
jgi:hypothetical protein